MNKISIIFILDMSGSMSILCQKSIDEFNKFILEYKQDNNSNIVFSLFLFNYNTNMIYDHVNINDVKQMDKKTYKPNGSTALYDAIGISIDNHIDYLSNLKKDDRPDRTLFVILTDGEENSSRIFEKEIIKEMIDECINIFNSDFIYLGANQDAFFVANNIGISMSNSVNYDYSSEGITMAYNKIRNATDSYINNDGNIVL